MYVTEASVVTVPSGVEQCLVIQCRFFREYQHKARVRISTEDLDHLFVGLIAYLMKTIPYHHHRRVTGQPLSSEELDHSIRLANIRRPDELQAGRQDSLLLQPDRLIDRGVFQVGSKVLPRLLLSALAA